MGIRQHKPPLICNTKVLTFLYIYKRFADFFWTIEYQNKLQIFKNYWKNTIQDIWIKRYSFAPGVENHTFWTFNQKKTDKLPYTQCFMDQTSWTNLHWGLFSINIFKYIYTYIHIYIYILYTDILLQIKYIIPWTWYKLS